MDKVMRTSRIMILSKDERYLVLVKRYANSKTASEAIKIKKSIEHIETSIFEKWIMILSNVEARRILLSRLGNSKINNYKENAKIIRKIKSIGENNIIDIKA